MTRSDTWECNCCGKKVEGLFPGDWATLTAEIGKGWLTLSAARSTHVCSARCGCSLLVGLYEKSHARDAAALKA